VRAGAAETCFDTGRLCPAVEKPMSIAAISQSFVAAVKRADAPAVEAVQPLQAIAPLAFEPAAREHGRRHTLVAATQQALGVDASALAQPGGEQAVFRFAHALLHDLRALAGDAADGPRAWGRRDWGDLPQQLGALATATAAPVAPVAPAPVAEAASALPDLPNPITTATAAVHIMKVPSSRLLEAFASMQRALGQASSSADDDRAALADVVKRLADRVVSTATAAPAPGAVLSVSA
jgi:hypothetical protein